MKYQNVRAAEFVLRRNRFICEIMLDGRIEECHVKNTGRLSELLYKGAGVYVTQSDNPLRKTKYDLVTAVKDGEYINIDSLAPNVAVREYLTRLYPEYGVYPERVFGNSRFDFYIERDGRGSFIEVKGVTLFRDGKALFPDAPTERGIKHLFELCECVRQGYGAYVLFVIAKDTRGKIVFSPNRSLGDDFAEALGRARACGVEVRAVDCMTGMDFMEIKGRIPTDF